MPTLDVVYKAVDSFKILHDSFMNTQTLGKKFHCQGVNNSWLYRTESGKKYKYGFNRWSISQLCQRMTFCVPTYNKGSRICPKLTQQMMRKFLGAYPDDLLIRYGNAGANGVRAVLSMNYQRYGYKMMLDFLEGQGIATDNNILEYYVDDTIFELILVMEDFSIGGDLYKAGFRFVNSEVGRSNIWMEFIIFRIGSVNGMIQPNPFIKQVHKGFFQTALETKIEVTWQQGPAITAQARQKLAAQRSRTLTPAELNALQRLVYESLTKKEGQAVQSIMAGKPVNYYEYANAVAAIANGFGLGGKTISVNFEKKEKLRKLAGKIMFQ